MCMLLCLLSAPRLRVKVEGMRNETVVCSYREPDQQLKNRIKGDWV